MPEVTSTATTDLLDRNDTPSVQYYSTRSDGSVQVVFEIHKPSERPS